MRQRATGNRQQQEPLFRLEDYWDEAVLGRVPCWGRRSTCLVNPAGKKGVIAEKGMRHIGCGDCDLFLMQKDIEERRVRRDAKAKKEAIRRWLRQKYSQDADHSPAEEASWDSDEQILKRLDREREEEENRDE